MHLPAARNGLKQVRQLFASSVWADTMKRSFSKACGTRRLASLADFDEIQSEQPTCLEPDVGGECMGFTSSTTSVRKRNRVGTLVYPCPVGPPEVAQGVKFMVDSLSVDERNFLELLFRKGIFLSSCCSGILFGPNGFAQTQHAVLDEDWSDLSCDLGRGIVVYEARGQPTSNSKDGHRAMDNNESIHGSERCENSSRYCPTWANGTQDPGRPGCDGGGMSSPPTGNNKSDGMRRQIANRPIWCS